MYDRILVALDGSELAEQILPHVEALARQLGSTVILLRATTSVATVVAQTTAGADPITPGLVDPTPMLEAERQEVGGYLARIAERLRGHGLTVQVEEPEGAAAEAILERCAALRVNLIAMTTHGRGGLGRLVFGSVADQVLRHASCPILLVRVSEEPAAAPDAPVI